jgi:pyruvate formate lyase activating enzyme
MTESPSGGGRPSEMKPFPARWWRAEEGGKILCYLCPRLCRIGEGQAGFCYIRQNVGGNLLSIGYGRPTGFAVDPIEKKPLNHFLPGTPVLSFGTAGCNLGCKFCQNWDISKNKLDELQSFPCTPDQVVELALREGCPSIAYTYNDPVIFAEFVIDVSRLARQAGLCNVLVTAGYVTPEARPELYQFIDAANVDLKGFSEEFYHKNTYAHLEPVLNTLVWLKKETDVWFEITTLLIPGLNDSEDEITRECAWIMENLGDRVPLHFTAFHPDFKMMDRPPTPPETLLRAREIGLRAGLKFVYLGNVHDREGQTTWCPGCGKPLIERDWHSVRTMRLEDGQCAGCGEKIPGVFAWPAVPAGSGEQRLDRPRRVLL